MVRFDALPSEQYKSESFLRSLESAVQDCMELNGQVEQLDEDISLNPAFIKRYEYQYNYVLILLILLILFSALLCL